MRSVITALALLVSTSLIGCRSAHIEDAYGSADEEGARRTTCANSGWPSYFLIVEMYSFREDTLLWPVLVAEPDVQDKNYFYVEDTVRVNWEEEELRLYQNVAPGKSDGKVIQVFELKAAEDPNDNEATLPFPVGNWRMDFYLNDEGSPSDSVSWVFSPECPFSPIPDTY